MRRFATVLVAGLLGLLAAQAALAADPVPNDGKTHKTLLGLVPNGITASCPGGQGDAALDSQQRWALNLPDPANTTRCRLIVAFSINPLYDRKEFGRLFAQNNGLVSIRFDGKDGVFQSRFAESGSTSGDQPAWQVRGDGVVLFSIGVSLLLETGRSFNLTFGFRNGADLKTQIYSAAIRVAVPAPQALPGIAAAPDTGQPRIAFRAYRVAINCGADTPVDFTRNGAVWLAPNTFSEARSQDCVIDLFFERHPQATDSTGQLTRALEEQGLRGRRHFSAGGVEGFDMRPGSWLPTYRPMGDARFVATMKVSQMLPRPGTEVDFYIPVSAGTWLLTEGMALRFLW